jgi:hypothetical protein
MKYVFVDIDHTLSHAAWRDHMAPRPDLDGDGDWDSYTMASSHDEPVREIVDLVLYLAARYIIVLITSRSDRHRALTNQWLLDAGLFGQFEALLMRPEDYDGMPSAILKPGMIIDYLKKSAQLPVRGSVAFVLEDRPDVVEAIKTLGVTCLQVHAVPR